VLTFAPKRLGVDVPDPGLDPVFAPKLKPPPVFPVPKGLAPDVAPPKRPPDAGFDVAGVDWPKIDEVEGVPLEPKMLGWLGPEVPVLPKLNDGVPDIVQVGMGERSLVSKRPVTAIRCRSYLS
jgi:hypothetical protein